MSYSKSRVAFHQFDYFTQEMHTWPGVVPGDLVVSPGTVAYNRNDYINRTSRTKVLHLRRGLLLVISCFDGTPDLNEPQDVQDKHRTFKVLSRHGVITIVNELLP